MTNPLTITPANDTVETGVTDADPVADALAEVLADTYCLIFKTHAYHWNVEGPLFYSVHNLTEEQYKDMFEAADELAERIRALGKIAPARMKDITNSSIVVDLDHMPSAIEMCTNLAGDHAQIAQRLHKLIDRAGECNDAVTEDLATQRSAFHEKAAWMLRSLAKH